MSWYLGVWQKYAVFSGRARRKEYWMFVLFNIIVAFLLGVVDRIIGWQLFNAGLLGSLYSLAVFLPGLAVSVRRLHDTNRSGWLILVALIPLIGWIILLIWYLQDSIPGPNRYGDSPKPLWQPLPNNVAGRTCPQCGVVVADDAEYCYHCSAKLN